MTGTQQLVLLILFVIEPVSSDQTDFIRDVTLIVGPICTGNCSPSVKSTKFGEKVVFNVVVKI